MDSVYEGLTEEQRDAAQAYAAEHGLAFESSGPDKDTGMFQIRLLTGDEGAPQWTGADIDAVQELIRA